MVHGVFQEERRGRQSVWRFVSYAQYSGSIKAHNDTAAQIQFCNDPRPYVTHCRSYSLPKLSLGPECRSH